MANETHTLRIGIDASAAKRGSQAYVSAVSKIAQATRDFEKLQGQLGKSMSKSGSFAAVARDLQRLNSLRLNPSLAKNITQMSAAMSSFRAPSSSSVKNFRSFVRELSGARLNPSVAKNLAAFSAAMATFKGPTRGSVAATQQFLRTISATRINPSVAAGVASISNALNNFKGPSSQSARNVQILGQALAQLRVPPGVGRLGGALTSLNGRFQSTSGAAVRLGGSVNGIPWGRASAGAIQLTGNLRGLENAMSLSYQMGTQLRILFGALTLSGFTSGVIEATTTSDRLQNVLMAVSDSQAEVNSQMEYAETVSRKYGLNYLEVERNLGRFTAATRTAGLSAEQSNFIFESLGRQSRLFGLDVAQQARAMLAITQGFQKGTVRAEEFRSQLGEQIPVWQFMVEAIAELKGVDASEIDLNKMMEMGQVGPDAYVLMFQKMEEALGSGIANAMKHPLVQMENLRTSWTKFLELVGKSGVMDALGDTAQRLSTIMDSDKFQSMAAGVAEGLSNAIIKVGDAAAYLLENIESVGKVVAAVLGLKAIATVGQLGLAFGTLGAMAASAVTNIGGFAMKLAGLGRFAGVLGAIPLAVGAIGAAFATAAIAAGVGLALMWDKTVKFGDETSTVGSMARVVFADIGNAATEAGQKIGELFNNMVSQASTAGPAIVGAIYPILNGVVDVIGMVAGAIGPIITQLMGLGGQLIQTVVSVGQAVATVFGGMFTAFNGELNNSQTTWRDWAKTVVGFIALVGETMLRVFRTAWRFVVQNTLDSFNIITKSIQGIGAAFNMVGSLAAFDTQSAARFAAEAGSLFGQVSDLADNAAKESAASLGDLFGGTNEAVDRYIGGLNFGDEGSTSAQDFVEGWSSELQKYGDDIFTRSLSPEFNPTRPVPPDVDTTAPSINMDGLNPILGAQEAELGALGKKAKDAADALKEFADTQEYLKAALESGKITLAQYNELLDHNKKKLEESADPYSALIRSMQEENNMLRLNGQEQRLASSFMEKKNALLEQGVSLTDEQTSALKKMIAEQDKLKNPSPLQSWIDGMEEFGDAIESAGVRAMEGLSDSLADLIVDGKADWASLAKTILKDLIKIGLNEVWKGMFGGAKTQQAVIEPMTGAKGQQTLLGMNTPAGSQSVMAAAVAQGIQMANAGMPQGMNGMGLMGNDTGGPLSFGDVQALNAGGIDAPGAGPGSWDSFQSMFGPQGKGAVAAPALGGGKAAGAATLMESMMGMHEDVNTVDINSFLKKGGIDINAAQTAWCAGFVNSSLEQMGIKGSGSLVATDFMNWGQGIKPEDVMRGDVMVKHNGLTPGSTGGHVGMATGQTRMGEFGQEYQMISGNASDQVQHDWYRAEQINFRRATPEMSQAGAAGLPGMSQPGMASPMGGQLMTPGMTPGAAMARPGMGSMIAPTTAGGGFSSLPGGMSLPGAGGAAGGGAMSALGGNDVSGMAQQFKAEMTPAFSELGQQFPQSMEPGLAQTANILPQKLTEGEGMGDSFATMMQPAQQQSAQGFQQAYMQANQQIAQNFAMVMQQAMSGAGGGMGGMMGGGGGGGGIGMLGSIMGAFFKTGGVVGQGGGSSKSISGGMGLWSGARSMEIGGIVGDPDAEPIIAHKGELVVPAHQVDAMRRMGSDTTLLDNAAVSSSRKRAERDSNGGGVDGEGGHTTNRSAPARPIINYNITTPNADSFRASQSQIQAKAGAAAYRDAARNH